MEEKILSDKDQLLLELIESINNITEAEGKICTFTNELETMQQGIGDILHYIEDPTVEISRSGAINLMNELQDLRKRRRQIKQMWEIWNVYGVNRDKLKQKDYRDQLIMNLRKKDKDLQTQYKYKQYTKEQLDELNEDKPLPRGRKPKTATISYNNNEEEIDNGNNN